jgi:hypothetical protein
MNSKTLERLTGASRQTIHRHGLANMPNDKLLIKARELHGSAVQNVEMHTAIMNGYAALIDVLEGAQHHD